MSLSIHEQAGACELSSNPARAPRACLNCLRRSWLLTELSPRLELRGRNLERLLSLLALSDEQLIDAVGGRSCEHLHARHAQFDPSWLHHPAGVQAVCSHDQHYPLGQNSGAVPRPALHLAGTAERLQSLLAEPVVVIAGSAYASDYGIQTARSIARGLAATGITVASGMAAGIPAAAHAGALDGGGQTFTVMSGGVDVCRPVGRRALCERVAQTGCAISELPCGFAPRRWCDPMRARLLVELASMVIVVEAQDRPHELALARVALTAGKTVAAIPGRVTSVASQGTNALLMRGAQLIRGPQDALDVLYGVGARELTRAESERTHELGGSAQKVLDRVGLGQDTLSKLTTAGADPAETLLALAQLELGGAILRGDGGRYVPARGGRDG